VTQKWWFWALLVVLAWCIYRWRGAHDAMVPLDLAFKYPLIPVRDLYEVAGGRAVVKDGKVVYK